VVGWLALSIAWHVVAVVATSRRQCPCASRHRCLLEHCPLAGWLLVLKMNVLWMLADGAVSC
jgi:hypothetical protein